MVYSYLLTRWHDEQDWQRLPTMIELRRIVLPAAQLSLPALARGTLCAIAESTPASTDSIDMHTEIIRDILHGVTFDEMVTADPNIGESVASLVRPWFSDPNDDRISKMLQPFAPGSIPSPSSSDSTWEIIRPYLVAASDVNLLAVFATRAAVMLSAQAQANTNLDEAVVLYERLLGGGVGRRLVLSQEHRRAALVIAQGSHRLATKWWAEMRSAQSDAKRERTLAIFRRI